MKLDPVTEGKQCVKEAFSLSSSMVLCLLNAPRISMYFGIHHSLEFTTTRMKSRSGYTELVVMKRGMKPSKKS